MLDRLLERLRPMEMEQARAAAEATPAPKRNARRQAGSSRLAIAYLTAVAPVDGPVSHRSRYSVDALIPAGHLAVVPLPDPAEAIMAELAALTPIATAKAEVAEPLADWERELLALPEGKPDPAVLRAFADMDAADDAEAAWFAAQAESEA